MKMYQSFLRVQRDQWFKTLFLLVTVPNEVSAIAVDGMVVPVHEEDRIEVIKICAGTLAHFGKLMLEAEERENVDRLNSPLLKAVTKLHAVN